MKVTDEKVNGDDAPTTQISALRLSAPAFTGFCSFLLSRGSMAAPTAK
jgi:hypothetical protein